MADNYLENQYEQYQARKAAWEKAKRNGVNKPMTPKADKKENTQKEEKSSEPGNQKL